MENSESLDVCFFHLNASQIINLFFTPGLEKNMVQWQTLSAAEYAQCSLKVITDIS